MTKDEVVHVLKLNAFKAHKSGTSWCYYIKGGAYKTWAYFLKKGDVLSLEWQEARKTRRVDLEVETLSLEELVTTITRIAAL